MKIHSKMKALECSQHFSHYKSMEILSDVQGQLTPQTLAQSCRISNTSKLLLLSLLPARMKKKIEELECSQEFPHFEHFQAFIAVLVTCKNEEENRRARMLTRISPLWPYGSYLLPWKPVLIRSGPKPNAANPPSQWCFRWNLIMIGKLVSEIFVSESVNGPTDAGSSPIL